MLKFFKFSGLLITFLLLQGFQSERKSLLFDGTLNCNSGAVQIGHGRSTVSSREESFSSLSAAGKRLIATGYSEAGVAKFGEILTSACKEELGSATEPEMTPKMDQSIPKPDFGIGATKRSHINPGPGSLVWLHKRDQIVTFSVFRDTASIVEYDNSGRPTSTESADRVAAYVMTKGEPDCKPISNVCVKCSDGKIICSIPALK